MNALDIAIDATVHNYKPGTNELAELMGMSRTILNNKACPTNENHQFHPQQLIQLQRQTGDWSISDAFTAAKKVWMENQGHESTGKSLTESVLTVTEDFAHVVHAVTEAMADRVLNERERRHCLDELEKMNSACEELKAALYREGVESKVRAVS